MSWILVGRHGRCSKPAAISAMCDVDKKSLSEADIRTKFITPAIQSAGWDLISQVREEVFFTNGRILWKGKTVKRGERKRADYILYYGPPAPFAEQQRIVATVDQLMSLCNDLESKLTQSKADSEKLMEAVVERAVRGV